jgi:hypothetical protein
VSGFSVQQHQLRRLVERVDQQRGKRRRRRRVRQHADEHAKLNFIRVAMSTRTDFAGRAFASGGGTARAVSGRAHHRFDRPRQRRRRHSVAASYFKTSTLYANENVYIARVLAYNNTGIRDKGGNSGNGILLADTINGTIERCVAHHNGALEQLPGRRPGRHLGVRRQRSPSSTTSRTRTRPARRRTAAGFDLDGGVTNSVMQYNYSHDNDGPGFLLCTFSGAAPGARTQSATTSARTTRERTATARHLHRRIGHRNAIVLRQHAVREQAVQRLQALRSCA